MIGRWIGMAERLETPHVVSYKSFLEELRVVKFKQPILPDQHAKKV